MAFYTNKKKIHIRHHIKKRHNSIIVGEDKENYDYITITHSPRKDKTHLNNKFYRNPNLSDNGDSYYENRIRVDVKKNFSKNSIKSWSISLKDLKKIEEVMERKNKK